MTIQPKRRRIEPAQPGGEAICVLTSDVAGRRLVPIDRLLAEGAFESTEDGYDVRLSRSAHAWELAETFIEEEAACCPSFAFEAAEEDDAIVVRATHPAVSR